MKSNTVIFTDAQRTLAIGAGQMSRVDAVNVAVMKARRAPDRSLAGSVAASDAFFPFRDGLDAVAAAGATAVVQPGGSVRDAEVIAAADEHGLAMVFTGTTAFQALIRQVWTSAERRTSSGVRVDGPVSSTAEVRQRSRASGDPSSSRVTVAGPNLPTTMPAAWLASDGGFGQRRAGGQRERERRDDRVAGAGHVRHLARDGRRSRLRRSRARAATCRARRA